AALLRAGWKPAVLRVRDQGSTRVPGDRTSPGCGVPPRISCASLRAQPANNVQGHIQADSRISAALGKGQDFGRTVLEDAIRAVVSGVRGRTFRAVPRGHG